MQIGDTVTETARPTQRPFPGFQTIKPFAFATSATGSPPRFELCIYADDVDRAAEELAAGGARILVPPADQPWGERLLYVEDPDGNPIQVTMRLEPA